MRRPTPAGALAKAWRIPGAGRVTFRSAQGFGMVRRGCQTARAGRGWWRSRYTPRVPVPGRAM